MKYRMLCVEDDSQIREIIEDYFTAKKENEFDITLAKDGLEAKDLLEENEFDIVLLDVMLPHLDGFSICRLIRKKSDVPVIFLTARTMEEDVLLGFETGCDDYVTKPFSLATLYAKCIALLNRAKGTVLSETSTIGKISINYNSMVVTVDGSIIELPPKEYELLAYLFKHKDWVISRETLLNAVWGYDFEGGERVVDNHIKKLRKNLGSAGEQIKTVISKGYKITEA
ncbi:MAG: response regulator transcription factor [Lachnospiraceae bacterium]|nr:response regulator transcription factor [Lachnospiraceae bacterium]